MNFSQYELDPRLLRNIHRAGYETPTPIQAAALPLALAGRDIVGTAMTGTGKTAAFVLPLLQQLLDLPPGGTRALVVTPTRELAEQIHQTVLALGQGTGLRSATIYGGVGMAPQEQALRRGTDILVACPGRLLDHMDRGTARLDRVAVLVLDEADQMLDMGFLPAVRRIVAKVPAARQTLLFSATFPPAVETLATDLLKRPERIAVDPPRPATTVSHALYPVAQHLKPDLLLKLLPRLGDGPVLVFARTRHRADRLARQLSHANYAVAALHSDRSQSQRQAALAAFKAGKVQVLVATDIAARGLDVAGVTHVINFDIPATAEAYIHRIGRTGRAALTGDAFTLVTPDDGAMVSAIEQTVGQPIPRLTLAGFDYEAPPRNSAAGSRPGRAATPSPAPARRHNGPAARPAAPVKPLPTAAPALATAQDRAARPLAAASAEPGGSQAGRRRRRRRWQGRS